MQIKKNLFHKLLNSDPEFQEKTLVEVGFVFLNDATEYLGKIVDSSEWNAPDQDRIRQYFERVYEEDADERIARYEEDFELIEEEKDDYKNYIIADAIENEYHPGIFFGRISSGDEEIVVLTQRTGGAWDCQATFVGVFRTIDEALDELVQSDSELI